jgi:hypothetical protein
MDPRAAAFTGGAPAEAPLKSQEEFEAELTGDSGSPIDAAVATELETREKLRARNESGEPDIAGHLKSVGPLKALKLNTPEQQEAESSDQTDPGTASAGSATDVMDLDAEAGAAPAPQAEPPRLSTQTLPTVVSKSGKQLYESTGPSGRWTPMVSAVFEPFTQHENPDMAAAAKRAQNMATTLIKVDGLTPKDAINAAKEYLNGEANRISQTERTKIGSRRVGGGGGGGGGLMGKAQDIAQPVDIYEDNAYQQSAKIQEEDRQYETIEAAASSGDPALQRDAVNQLLKIRSGTAVTAAEDARISQINGLLAQVQDRLGRWTGGAMTPEMQKTIQQIVSLKRQVSQAKIKRIYDHQAKLYEVQNRGKTKDPGVLQERAKVLREGGLAPGETAEEDLY